VVIDNAHQLISTVGRGVISVVWYYNTSTLSAVLYTSCAVRAVKSGAICLAKVATRLRAVHTLIKQASR